MPRLVELRVLDGANLYFSRAAVKLTLDVSALVDAPAPAAKAFGQAIGLGTTRPGRIGSGFRQRFAIRVVGHSYGGSPREAGIGRIGVRVRPESDVRRLVVAFPWAHEDRARALGGAIVEVLDAFGADDLTDLITTVGDRVRNEPPGNPPPTLRPKVPVVAVTGTNGKTTTSRMIAHIGRAAGLHVGWSSTDGVYFDGELVKYGDYSGPSGAGQVLSQPGIQLAVTETARGGILRRGVGVISNDVSVVTNVTADHLGLGGIDTVDQLAEVKAVITTHHPAARLVRRERRRPADVRDAARFAGQVLGVLARPRLAVDPDRAGRGRPGDDRPGRIHHGARPGQRP